MAEQEEPKEFGGFRGNMIQEAKVPWFPPCRRLTLYRPGRPESPLLPVVRASQRTLGDGFSQNSQGLDGQRQDIPRNSVDTSSGPLPPQPLPPLLQPCRHSDFSFPSSLSTALPHSPAPTSKAGWWRGGNLPPALTGAVAAASQLSEHWHFLDLSHLLPLPGPQPVITKCSPFS